MVWRVVFDLLGFIGFGLGDDDPFEFGFVVLDIGDVVFGVPRGVVGLGTSAK